MKVNPNFMLVDPLQQKGFSEKEILEKALEVYLKVTFREEII